MHPVQLACTAGPTSVPHICEPPLDELDALLDDAPLDDAPLELDPVLLLLDPEPHTFMIGMQTLPGLPSMVEIGVHA